MIACRTPVYALVAMSCCSPVAPLSGEVKAMEETISGRSFRAIEVAAAELARSNLDISLYRITVTEEGTSVVVIFIDANATGEEKKRFRGSPGNIPAFEVELGRDDLRVIRSNFVR